MNFIYKKIYLPKYFYFDFLHFYFSVKKITDKKYKPHETSKTIKLDKEN